VADLAAAVTDTHALIFHAVGRSVLGPKARAQFAGAEAGKCLVYVPAAVIWEVGLLARAVRVNLRRPVRAFFADLFSNPAYQPHDLTAAQVFDADDLRFTRDPFDALIVAAARDLDLPLLTRDADIRASGTVRVLW
jgi:PIN domain nuclease of toxin-antitoxin system